MPTRDSQAVMRFGVAAMPVVRVWRLGRLRGGMYQALSAVWALAAALAALLAALVAAGPAAAADDAVSSASVAQQRQRIAQARALAHARYAEAERACAGRFQLNRCLDEARAERREALEALRREQVALDDAERRQRAEARLAAIEQRRRDAEAHRALQAAEASPPASAGAHAAAASAAARGSRAADRASEPRPPRPEMRVRDRAAPTGSDTAQRQAEAQRRAEAYAARQAAAASHAEAVARRNAQRDAKRPPAAGLPLPAALPASAAAGLNPPTGR